MNLNNNFRRLGLMMALAMLPGIKAFAGECNLSRDADWGLLKGTCELSAFFPKTTAIINYVRPSLPIPNLVPDDAEYFVTNDEVDVSVDIENNGTAQARMPMVDVAVQVWQRSTLVGTYTFPNVRLNDIAAGGSVAAYIGTIAVDREFDNDLFTIISVDTPTAAAPRGVIRESNETDNIATKRCRVYSLVDPDTSVGPCN